MTALTLDKVTLLAPDPQSIKAAQKLALPAKWSLLGKSGETTLWGECKGSGSRPYQTRVDLTGPAYKCSCPSRKFPCKHTLALLMLYVTFRVEFNNGEPPNWVAEWLTSRNKRAEIKQQKSRKQVDPDAQAKRAAKREKQVTQGLEELSLWLQDIVRTGLGHLQGKPYNYWDAMAARMVDAQAPGVARRVHDMGGICNSGEQWYEAALAQFAKLHLLISAYSHINSLDASLQQEVRSQIGWTIDKEEVLAAKAIDDHWSVWGQYHECDDNNLHTQRTWLQGRDSGRWALLLEFAHDSMPMESNLFPGTCQQAALCFYPGKSALRAAIKERGPATASPICHCGTLQDFNANLQCYADALSQNPWVERFPMLINNVNPSMHGETITICDQEGYSIPLNDNNGHAWQIIALSGGNTVTCFGEWDGHQLHLLALLAGEQHVIL